MEQQQLIKLIEERVAVITDGARALHAHAEDLAFRSQSVSHAVKNGNPVRDRMFGDDLLIFHKGLNVFCATVLELPNLLSRLDGEARSEADAVRSMQSLFRAVSGLQKEMRGVQASASLAHQHLRNTPFKVESTYIGLELEKMTQKTDLLPQACNKILNTVSAPFPDS